MGEEASKQWQWEWESLLNELISAFRLVGAVQTTIRNANDGNTKALDIYECLKSSSQQIAGAFANVSNLLTSPASSSQEWQHGLCHSLLGNAHKLSAPTLGDCFSVSTCCTPLSFQTQNQTRQSAESQAFSGTQLVHSNSVTPSKKRKTQPRWVKRVAVSSTEGSTDTLPEDGYTWRKYGQKEILGAKYPRSYYRCTHKKRGCDAKKQVQRPDDDDSVLVVTYSGRHTCNNDARGQSTLQVTSSPPWALLKGASASELAPVPKDEAMAFMEMQVDEDEPLSLSTSYADTVMGMAFDFCDSTGEDFGVACGSSNASTAGSPMPTPTPTPAPASALELGPPFQDFPLPLWCFPFSDFSETPAGPPQSFT